MKNYKITIGIPTINRADLLKETLDDVSKKMKKLEHLIIVDNGKQKIDIPKNLVDKTLVTTPENNLGVAASWNYMMDKAFNEFDSDYILLLNDDIVFGKSYSALEQIIRDNEDPLLALSTYFWSVALISKECYKLVGDFDELFFPAYYEDNDYAFRLRLLGGKLSHIDALEPIIKRNSQTIKKAPHLNDNFTKNKRLYMKKWGGQPGKEKFKKPFNGRDVKVKTDVPNKEKKTDSTVPINLKSAYKKLGTKKKFGSSVHSGKAYHELPFPDEQKLPTHRKSLAKRTSVIKKKTKVKNKYGIDLGCSVGGFVFDLQKSGAQMVGLDYDQQSINVALAAENKYKTGANFECTDINMDTYLEALEKYSNIKTGRFDFCIWYSQFMWMVKAHGEEESLKFLKHLSETCDELWFETSQGDKAAGALMKKMGITHTQAVLKLLQDNTCYTDIKDLGQAGDGWSKRHIFRCRKPSKTVVPEKIQQNLDTLKKIKKLKEEEEKERLEEKETWKHNKIHRGVTSQVKTFPDKGIVRKIYKKDYLHCKKFEVTALQKLQKLDSPHFPKLIEEHNGHIEIEITDGGLTKHNMPENYQEQCREILDVLNKADVVHRDIKPDNIHIKNGQIVLIDFGWASSKKDVNSRPKKSGGLGGRYKHPKGYNDKYSLNKSIEAIRKRK